MAPGDNVFELDRAGATKGTCVTDAAGTPLERLLRAVAEGVLSYPRAILVVYLVCAGGSALSAFFWLDLNTAQNALVSNDLPYNQRYHEYREEFGDQEQVYLVVEITDLPTAQRVADEIAEALEPLQRRKYSTHLSN